METNRQIKYKNLYILLWCILTCIHLFIFGMEFSKRFTSGIFYIFMLDRVSIIKHGMFGALSLMFTIMLYANMLAKVQRVLKLTPYIILFYAVMKIIIDSALGYVIDIFPILDIVLIVLAIKTCKAANISITVQEVRVQNPILFYGTILGYPCLGGLLTWWYFSIDKF